MTFSKVDFKKLYEVDFTDRAALYVGRWGFDLSSYHCHYFTWVRILSAYGKKRKTVFFAFFCQRTEATLQIINP